MARYKIKVDVLLFKVFEITTLLILVRQADTD